MLSTFELLKTQLFQGKTIVLTSEEVNALQQTVLFIAKDVFDFCEKNNISIYLGGGSALGCIRNKGFIPWDDDIDLNMPREDFNRFIELFPTKFSDKYWIHTPDSTVQYNKLMTKVLLKGTIVREFADRNSDECGAFIDIFPIENTFDNLFLRLIHGLGCIILSGVVSCRRFYNESKNILPFIQKGSKLYVAIKLKSLLGYLVKWLPLEKWIQITNKWNKICQNSHSKYVVIPTGRKRFFGELYKRETYLKILRASFEGNLWPITADYHNYLTRLYGEYMVPPPPDKREHHLLLEFDLGGYKSSGE